MPGTLDFRWDPLELAADNTFSTTIRIEISNWWEIGAPKKVLISVRQEGEDLPPGHEVLVQKGKAVHPLTGLEPRHHYHVVVSGEDRPVEKLIPVPELSKPKTPEQELLESEKIHLERVRIYSENKKLATQEKKPTPDEKETKVLKAKTEKVKAETELKKAQEKPDPDEQALKSERTRLERAKVSRELKEVTQGKPKKPGEEELEAERIQLERARIAHDIKELVQQKPKIPKRVSVTISGERGRQKLLISVSAEDNSFIPGFIGTVQDGSMVTNYTIKDDGTAVYETNFQESSRPFEIRAGSLPDLVWRARLLGPKPERKE